MLRHSQEFLVVGDPQAVEMEETPDPDGKVPPVLALAPAATPLA